MSQAPAGPYQPIPSASPQADPPGETQVVRQIVTHILNHGTDSRGQARFEIRLDPPELGRVDVSLEISDRQTRVSVVADRWMAGDLLRRNAEILAQQLRDSGFATLDLHFSDRSGNGAGAQPRAEEFGAEPGAVQAPQETARDMGTTPARRSAGAAGLDLRV